MKTTTFMIPRTPVGRIIVSALLLKLIFYVQFSVSSCHNTVLRFRHNLTLGSGWKTSWFATYCVLVTTKWLHVSLKYTWLCHHKNSWRWSIFMWKRAVFACHEKQAYIVPSQPISVTMVPGLDSISFWICAWHTADLGGICGLQKC